MYFVAYSLALVYVGAYWNAPILGFHKKVIRAVKAAFEAYDG